LGGPGTISCCRNALFKKKTRGKRRKHVATAKQRAIAWNLSRGAGFKGGIKGDVKWRRGKEGRGLGKYVGEGDASSGAAASTVEKILSS